VHRGQRGRGKQHQSKFCHDDFSPRKNLGNERSRQLDEAAAGETINE
jgi:hypothetical protein